MTICLSCLLRVHGRCRDPFGREGTCFCFAGNELHRYQHGSADDGMSFDLEHDQGDGGLGSGHYIERWEDEREKHEERTR